MIHSRPTTHIRIFKSDRNLLNQYMRRYNIRSQAEAVRRLMKRLK